MNELVSVVLGALWVQTPEHRSHARLPEVVDQVKTCFCTHVIMSGEFTLNGI
jgi:hypothetical protein